MEFGRGGVIAGGQTGSDMFVIIKNTTMNAAVTHRINERTYLMSKCHKREARPKRNYNQER